MNLSFPFSDPPAPGAAVEVVPDIFWLRLPLPMALDHVNVYALADAQGWTLIDTGFASGKTRAMWQAALAGPLAGRQVHRLIVTHHHPDHVGLAGWFQARGAELMMTRTAWLYARMLTLDLHERPTDEALAFLRRAGLDDEALRQRARERPFNFADVVAPMPQGFTRLSEGDEIVAAGRRWHVRLGSGHAPDHATFWSLDDPLVIGGDQLLPGISANIGVYPTEPEADPLADWLASCRRFQTFAHPEQLVLPGHKLPYRGLPGRLATMIAEHEEALEALRRLLATPRRATEVFPALFKREIAPSQFSMALAEALAHLNHLLQRGAATRQAAPDGAWLWQAR